MGSIIVSIAVKKSIVAIMIIEDGQVKLRITERIKDSHALESNHASMIYAFMLALRYVRQYIQDNKTSSDIYFEVSNSTFVKWVENRYSKETYQEDFIKAMQLLQELPIRYSFVYASKPKAMEYADAKYCKKEVISGLSID